MTQAPVSEPEIKHPDTKEEFQEAVDDMAKKITTMCIVNCKASPAVVLISLLTAAEAVFEVVAYFEQVEQVRDKLEDTKQKELGTVIAKWVGLFTDAIVRGKERFLEEKASERIADT